MNSHVDIHRLSKSTEELEIEAADGFKLSARLHLPDGEPESLVIINGAIGIHKEYYKHFANYLVEKKHMVVTYDYRGIGGSLNSPIRGFQGTMSDWGEKDLEGVIRYCQQHFTNIPMLCVGHSAGGQMVGLAPSNDSFRAVFTVASQVGYFKLWTGAEKVKLWIKINWFVPGLTKLFGFFPGETLGTSNLPAPIAREMCKWCNHKDFIVDNAGKPKREHFASYNGRMMFYSFHDDADYAPQTAVHALADYYSAADKEFKHFLSDELRPYKMGHFGFFRKECPKKHWAAAAEWLESNLQSNF